MMKFEMDRFLCMRLQVLLGALILLATIVQVWTPSDAPITKAVILGMHGKLVEEAMHYSLSHPHMHLAISQLGPDANYNRECKGCHLYTTIERLLQRQPWAKVEPREDNRLSSTGACERRRFIHETSSQLQAIRDQLPTRQLTSSCQQKVARLVQELHRTISGGSTSEDSSSPDVQSQIVNWENDAYELCGWISSHSLSSSIDDVSLSSVIKCNIDIKTIQSRLDFGAYTCRDDFRKEITQLALNLLMATDDEDIHQLADEIIHRV